MGVNFGVFANFFVDKNVRFDCYRERKAKQREEKGFLRVWFLLHRISSFACSPLNFCGRSLMGYGKKGVTGTRETSPPLVLACVAVPRLYSFNFAALRYSFPQNVAKYQQHPLIQQETKPSPVVDYHF